MILVVVLASYFMILLDNSVIFTSLSAIRASLGFSDSGLAWMSDAYTLVFGGLLLLGARAGDLLGRRRVFLVGLALFSLASLLVGVAPTAGFAIAARALQGVGASIVAPSSLSLITASFPAGPQRARAIALYGAMAGIGASVGMVLGGAVTAWISWRVGLLVNVPIGLTMMLLAPRYLPETPRATGRFDTVGAVTATAGVGALVFGIIHSAEAGWLSAMTLAPLTAAVVLLGLLVVNESRAEQPIMPLRLFTSSERVAAYVARFLFVGAMFGFFFFGSQYMQGVLGFSALQAGLGFLPMTLVNFVVAMTMGGLVARLGQGRTAVVGIGLVALGMIWLAQVGAASSYWAAVAAPMVLIGAGQGLVFAPLTALGLHGAAAEDAGAASGLVNTFHQVGSSVGLGVLVTLTAHPTGADALHQFVTRTHVALLGSTGLLVLAVIALLASGAHRAR